MADAFEYRVRIRPDEALALIASSINQDRYKYGYIAGRPETKFEFTGKIAAIRST